LDTTLLELDSPPSFLGNGRWSMTISSGEIPTGHTYSHTDDIPGPLTAARDEQGDLSVLSGEVEVSGPPAFTSQGWEGRRGPTRLTSTGPVADGIRLVLPLPAGLVPLAHGLLLIHHLRVLTKEANGCVGSSGAQLRLAPRRLHLALKHHPAGRSSPTAASSRRYCGPPGLLRQPILHNRHSRTPTPNRA
jgi:hypothetical protein